MLNNDTITCSSCAREWDGNAQCPCWMNGQDDVLDISLPLGDALSWHHLSKEQVIKGIISQLCEGRFPHEVSILIWRELKLSQKADEDLQRSYYVQGIRLITRSPKIIPKGRGLEWQIQSSHRFSTFSERIRSRTSRILVTIQMIGSARFLYEGESLPIDPDHPSDPCQILYGPASLKSKMKYIKDQDENYYDLLSHYNDCMIFGIHHIIKNEPLVYIAL